MWWVVSTVEHNLHEVVVSATGKVIAVTAAL